MFLLREQLLAQYNILYIHADKWRFCVGWMQTNMLHTVFVCVVIATDSSHMFDSVQLIELRTTSSSRR